MTRRFFEVWFWQVVDGEDFFRKVTVQASHEFEAVDTVQFGVVAAGTFKALHFVHEVDG